MIVSVIGAGKTNPETYQMAEELGAELARKTIIVVCGGLSGVMEAVCKGARSRGGLTIGILPHDLRSEANQYVDIAIPTGLGIARNVIVVKTGEAVIALDGEYGTLAEMAIALAELKPVISLNNWTLPNNMHRNVIFASSPHDAVEKAVKAVSELSK